MNSRTGAGLYHLDRLFHHGTVTGLSESALLDRYVTERDEAAFAALVARHGPMVLGVCRRILRDEREVEDAFQATFLVLVRRAGSIRDGNRIGPWLHGVAHRVAVRARAHSARRSVHEPSTEIAVEPVTTPDDPARRELATIVDEEVARLPSNLRAPVWLCYFEGMSHDEAARRLRWPVGTVRSRMARARDLLRHRLARRGVSADASIVAATLLRMPVPPAWIDATVRHSLTFATGTATAAASIASIRSAALARRVLQAMVIAKLSYVSAAGLGFVLALVGAQTLASQGKAKAKPGESASPKAPSQAPDKHRPGQSFNEGLSALEDAATLELTDLEMYLLWQEIETELHRTKDSLQNLQAWVEKLKSARMKPQYDSLRRKNPAPSRLEPPVPRERPPFGVPNTDPEPRGFTRHPASATPPTPGRKGENEGHADRPQYFSWHESIIVISPDGAKAALLDTRTNSYTPLKLPEMAGVRREFLFTPQPLPTTAIKPDPNHPGIRPLLDHCLYAVELDQDQNAIGLLAVNTGVGGSASVDLPQPYAGRDSVRMIAPGLIQARGGLYAFSPTACRWGRLPSYSESPIIDRTGIRVLSREGDRIYRFNQTTGEWDDLYGRAMRAVQKSNRAMEFDTRFPDRGGGERSSSPGAGSSKKIQEN